MTREKVLIVGLGNPGTEYANTRHNVGFMVCDLLARRLGFPGWLKQNNSKVTYGAFIGADLVIAKPCTYMNLSGNAVLSLITTYKLSVGNILIIVDDVALPFGKIRIRPSGSDGGHNGLLSIIEKLGRNDFARLRVGVDPPPPGVDMADYVTSPFTEEQRQKLPDILSKSADAVITYLNEGIESAMNKYN